jgi:hypothetical protein
MYCLHILSQYVFWPSCIVQPTISWHVSYSPVDGRMLDQWNVCVCMYVCTLSFPSQWLFFMRFLHKIFCTHSLKPSFTCLAHQILLYFTILISDDPHNWQSFSLWRILYSSLISSLISPNMFLSDLFSDICNLHSSLDVRHHTLHTKQLAKYCFIYPNLIECIILLLSYDETFDVLKLWYVLLPPHAVTYFRIYGVVVLTWVGASSHSYEGTTSSHQFWQCCSPCGA